MQQKLNLNVGPSCNARRLGHSRLYLVAQITYLTKERKKSLCK